MSRASQLFHAIVVVGSAMAPSCGGKAVIDGGLGGAGGAGGSSSKTTTGATTGNTNGSTSGFVSAGPGGVTGAGGSTGVSTVTGGSPHSPSECVKTADFHCQSYKPYTNCQCVPGSPSKKEDCGSAPFQCDGGYDPPIGCECIAIIK